jgi:hypothetical protein
MDVMTLTICVVFLVGVALSLRFNFLVLYPGIIFVVIGAAARTYGDGIGTTALMMALGAAAVQMGYLFGLVRRAAIASFGVPERKGNSAHSRRAPDSEPSTIRSPLAGTVATMGRRLAS